MRVHFTGRHVEVTPALEDHARDRLEKLQKLLPAIVEAHVILSVEKYRHRAEVNVHMRRLDLSAVHETGDMYASLTQVFEKLERQAQKRKDRFRSRKRRAHGPARPPEAAAAEGTDPVRAPGSRLAGPPNSRPPRLVRIESPDLKPMSIEDAVLEVQDSESGFLVFRNARSQRVNVVYRRGDGRFGVIEA